MPNQNAAGLDMFVGSGLDYLSEVSLEDLDTDLLNSNMSPKLVHESATGFTPLAASLGTFGPGSRYMLDPHLPSVAQLSQLPFMPAASWSLGVLTRRSCWCMNELESEGACLLLVQDQALVNLHSHLATYMQQWTLICRHIVMQITVALLLGQESST